MAHGQFLGEANGCSLEVVQECDSEDGHFEEIQIDKQPQPSHPIKKWGELFLRGVTKKKKEKHQKQLPKAYSTLTPEFGTSWTETFHESTNLESIASSKQW